MRNIIFGIVIAVVIVFGLRYCEHEKDKREQLEANTALIQKQIQNVGKLIVTEGTYAQVFTYEDWKKFYLDVLSARKKALVVVNAKATVSYDLSKIQTTIDEENRIVTISHIPEPELEINPDIQYYDVQQDYFNQFSAADYNKIKDKVATSLRSKIEASELMNNAQNRLISELQKIYILTNSMGWTLEYKEQLIQQEEDLQEIVPLKN
jgi:ribosome-binding ATPase YchF (GTP1/OBG family)